MAKCRRPCSLDKSLLDFHHNHKPLTLLLTLTFPANTVTLHPLTWHTLQLLLTTILTVLLKARFLWPMLRITCYSALRPSLINLLPSRLSSFPATFIRFFLPTSAINLASIGLFPVCLLESWKKHSRLGNCSNFPVHWLLILKGMAISCC